MQSLRQRISELEQALQHERQHSQLVTAELQRLKGQQGWHGSLPLSTAGPAHCSDWQGQCPVVEAACCSGAAADEAHGHVAAAASAAAAAAAAGAAPQPHHHHYHPSQHQPQQHQHHHHIHQQQQQDQQPAATAGPGTPGDDMVLVSRQQLELLYLKERAMDAVKEGITIADCSQPDMPLIYINEGFTRMTGYSRDYTLHKNCRCGEMGCPLVACWGPAWY